HGVVKLHDLAEYRPLGREGGHVLTTVGRILWNDKIERALQTALGAEFDPSTFEFINHSMKKKDTTKLVDALVQTYGAPTVAQVLRSEERRVGKECRAGWGRCHEQADGSASSGGRESW